ncbi:hypothetical protein LTR91_023203 [Friedmanniomyces endolithicus]|uniref:FAD-binding domain-containing protein n=1 Tax=Friedmanniomyces endolithicus TaxID=329885 RepID=A0AAN6H3H7_9PEZI|nr:hypothetical protein LTR57_024123 [Friedmanniomyces endolithicus]KAK0953987.1 hypothetical protein LTS01_024128 [Friedmanniomyces endolithicus]KAK0954648.1 hypothetical protein LTR91_023203 [Friedmanniomyces endolithicus]KAK1022682.1 hypothetical protein LTS16_025521 [Friedmanniomyces endolithicus]
MSSNLSHVAIIGGGLALHGIRSTIYEYRSEDDSGGVNITLAPNAARVLQHIGVLDELRTLGHTYELMTISAARNGQALGAFFNGTCVAPESKAQGIEIFFNKKLVAVENETDMGVRIRFEDGQVAEAEYVIAADGIHSLARSYIVQPELRYSGAMGIAITGVIKDSLHVSVKGKSLPTFCFGQTGMIAVSPSNPHGDEVDIFSTMPFPERSREEWKALAADGDAKQKIMVERFGSGWPLYISQVWQDEPSARFELYPSLNILRGATS